MWKMIQARKHGPVSKRISLYIGNTFPINEYLSLNLKTLLTG
jgi:hypothetical protein